MPSIIPRTASGFTRWQHPITAHLKGNGIMDAPTIAQLNTADETDWDGSMVWIDRGALWLSTSAPYSSTTTIYPDGSRVDA